MRLRYFLIVPLLIFCFSKLNAQTYTVTSNADSGPGTLREGLQQAHSALRTSTFTIKFNLPGDPSDDANRTIRLRSVLPHVTSNTIIDGSSQASWPSLGNSGAKIILVPEFPNVTFSGLIIGEQYSFEEDQTANVEVYGLYIRNFANITNLQTVNTSQGSGIVIAYRANNVTIGAPGKGNVFGGNLNGILIQTYTGYQLNPLSKIKIQSNIIGLRYDGVTPHLNVRGVQADLYDCSLDVGGDNAGEGNIIAANQINLDIRRPYSTNTRFDINIVKNKIGVDASGKKDFHELPIFLSSSSLELIGLKIDAVNTALYVRDNIIGGNRTAGVSLTNADFILTGNAVGTDASGTENLGNGIGIKLGTNTTGEIGGDTDAEKNLIAHNNFGIETVSSRPVKITRNSMFCNRTFGIGKTLTILQPYIQILKKRANYVSGKASPNSDVELFYTENCEGICEGKTYITTVQAGSDGRWEYNGSLSGKVTATASLLNATTSPFSTAELLPDEAIVNPVTCTANGSVSNPEPREGFTFSWVKIESDGSRVPKGNTQSISGLEIGTYEVTVDDGCKAFATAFDIKDQKLTKPIVSSPPPGCGQTSFSFTASVVRGKGTIRFEWYSTASPTVILSTSSSANFPEGTYFVRAKDDAGCTLDSDPITVKRKPQPIINRSNLVVGPAACGKPNGFIRGISIDDVTGTATYQWQRYDDVRKEYGPVVSTALELKDVEGGNYRLTVRDQGQCSPVSTEFHISIYNTVTISFGSITPGRCGQNNGIIDNVSIQDADLYEWFDPYGISIKKGVYSPGLSLRITDLEPGTYTLVASNTLSTCSESRAFAVNALPPTIFEFTHNITSTSCELLNGRISLNYTSFKTPVNYEWRDESGTKIPGTASEIKDLAPGNYRLYAYDENNCESTYGPFTVNAIPKLTIKPNSAAVSNDGCGLKRGSITGIEILGGVASYEFKWINEAGDAVQYTQDLIDVGAGRYRLEVKDKTSCGYAISEEYVVDDLPFIILPPVVNDIRVCYVSDITLPVVAPEEGIYQLFADSTDHSPLLESNSGIFNFKANKTTDYYIRRKLGSCTSVFTKMHIEVVHDNLEAGNVITPNGDGRNDTWLLTGLPDYDANNIKIYSRSGQLVYESIGNYTKPFNGRFRGVDLPAGVYYFIVDLRGECKPFTGSITLLR